MSINIVIHKNILKYQFVKDGVYMNKIKSAFREKKLKVLSSFFIIIIAIYQLLSIAFVIVPLNQNKIIFVAAGAILVLLTVPFKKGSNKKIDNIISWFLTALILISSFYFFINFTEITKSIGVAETGVTVFGIIIVIVVLETTRRAWGMIIPSLAILAMLYGYFGNYLPGILNHGGISIDRLFGYTITNFQGIYGSLTAIGIREVFTFLLVGTFLQSAGFVEFAMRLSSVVGNNIRSGPAQASIVSSAFMGSVNGNVTTNVVTTGSVTIPLMKKNGYSSEYAGAIECAASTGAQITPPVMGAAVFIMANITGIDYFSIVIAAAFPAMIYYLFLSASSQFRAMKINIPLQKKPKKGELKQSIKTGGYLLIPLFFLIYVLYIGTSITTAGLHTVLAIIILYTIRTFIIYKQNFKAALYDVGTFMYKSLKEGSINGLKLVLMLATLDIMVEMITATGLSQKISYSMVDAAGSSLILLLIYVALTCILFGLGIPTSGAYVTVALLAAPALTSFGIPLLSAHLFVLYYALMSNVTPPIGSAAIIASGISGGSYMKTAIYALRLTLPGFTLPILFVFRPELLMLEGSILVKLFSVIGVLFALLAISALLEMYMFNKLKIWEIALLIVSIIAIFIPGLFTAILTTILFTLVGVNQIFSWKKSQVQQA